MLTNRANSQNASITGLTSSGDQVISIESHSDKLGFYDLRRPDSLLYVCSLEREFYEYFPEEGSNSMAITDAASASR